MKKPLPFRSEVVFVPDEERVIAAYLVRLDSTPGTLVAERSMEDTAIGPYCRFCQTRCFAHLPANTPQEIRTAYGTSTIIATCAAGQVFEVQEVGWSWDLIQEAIEGAPRCHNASR